MHPATAAKVELEDFNRNESTQQEHKTRQELYDDYSRLVKIENELKRTGGIGTNYGGKEGAEQLRFIQEQEQAAKRLVDNMSGLAPAINDAHSQFVDLKADLDDFNKKLTGEEEKLKESIYYDLTHNKLTPAEILANDKYKGYFSGLITDKQIAEQVSALFDEITGKSKALKKSALNTSDLSGASGGLSQAKAIVINFNSGSAVQRNEVKDGSGIQANADRGVEILIRTLNNFTYSQSGTM